MNRLIRYSLYLVPVILSLLLQPFEQAGTKYVQSSVIESYQDDNQLGSSFSKIESNIHSLSLIEGSDVVVSVSEIPSYSTNNLQKEQAAKNHHARKLSDKQKLYLSSLQRITPSLSIQDIAYPFHYFW